MRSTTTLALIAAAGVTVVCAMATPAAAKCTTMSFSVNDYGKDGPTRDAKNLLDKHIAEWAKKRGIAHYTVGKKDVKCELFLNFIVFDEHTCKASAQVCWGDGAQPAAPGSAEPGPPAVKPAPRPPAAKKAQMPG
jgi:hypothetical protein